MQILQLDIQGVPQKWIPPEQAALHYATSSVVWTVGEACMVLRGGQNAVSGQQSMMAIHPIIALDGAARVNLFDAVPSLSNYKLFRRDRMTCGYCGNLFPERGLTREHIAPVSRGGPDVWANVVSACRGCNGRKGARTPEEARMPLVYLPYVPSLHEDFILAGRNIRADVHDWLAARVPRHSRLH